LRGSLSSQWLQKSQTAHAKCLTKQALYDSCCSACIRKAINYHPESNI